MAIQLKRRTPDSKTKDIVVPYEEILAEEEAERLQMHLDLESGRITPAEMMRRNCIDWGDTTLLRRTTRPEASGGPDGDKQG